MFDQPFINFKLHPQLEINTKVTAEKRTVFRLT